MNITCIQIVNMDHIANTFSYRADFDKPHPTQKRLRSIKLALLFWIPGEPLDEPQRIDTYKQDPLNIPRLASVQVPRGTPILRLRDLIRYCQKELLNIYGHATRAKIVLVCEENSDNWKWEFDLPTFGVMYV